jgi:hypothetical protein
MTPGAAILPPDPYREPTRVALAHQFAKALLNLDSRCAESSRCSCNWLLDMSRRVPAAHPQQTGELKLDDISRRRSADTPRPRAQTSPDLTRDTPWRPRPSAPSDSAPHITPEAWRRLHGVADDLDAYDEPPTARDDDDPAS